MIKHIAIIGIDPGKKGAIVVMYPEMKLSIKTKQMPLISNEFNMQGLHEMLYKEYIQFLAGHVFIEEVHAIYGSAAGATFTFGGIYYAIQMAVVALGIPYTLVQPKVWQKEMYQGIPEIRKPDITIKKGKRKGQKVKGPRDTKAMSLLAAQRLFPHVSLLASERSSKPHDGIVDALLIAEYGKRLLSHT